MVNLFIRAVPLAQRAVDTVHSWLAQVTPAVWLAAVLGLVALVLVSIVGTALAHLMHRWLEHRQRAAESAWCAYVMADRAQVSTRVAEYEALWK